MTDSDEKHHRRPLRAEDASEGAEDEAFAANYGLAIGIGLPLGAILGMIFFDNLALGAAFGLVIAPVVALVMNNAKS